MAIPDYQALMLPMLRLLRDGNEHPLGEVRSALATEIGITQDEAEALLPSGNQGVFANRVGWARTYLKMAALIEYVRRGVLRITPRGLTVLEQAPPSINVAYLDQFPEFQTFRQTKRAVKGPEREEAPELETPDEVIENAYQRLRTDLASDLLDQIKPASPRFFEQLVVDLLLKMGYGGSRQEAGSAIGKSGDEGIDGIIKEDRLGLDVIYIQAKRWEGTVGRPEVQKFAGALQGQRAHKGVFLTTGGFSREAGDYAAMIDTKIILIDGRRLADLMIEHSVGVATTTLYDIKKIDTDYFFEE